MFLSHPQYKYSGLQVGLKFPPPGFENNDPPPTLHPHPHPLQFTQICFRSRSTRDHYQKFWNADEGVQDCKEPCEIIFVGSSRRRYVISSKYLNHPLLNALIERSRGKPGLDGDPDLYVKCEVVLFDHLLWMLENGDPDLSSDSLEELAELYVY